MPSGGGAGKAAGGENGDGVARKDVQKTAAMVQIGMGSDSNIKMSAEQRHNGRKSGGYSPAGRTGVNKKADGTGTGEFYKFRIALADGEKIKRKFGGRREESDVPEGGVKEEGSGEKEKKFRGHSGYGVLSI